MRVAIRADASVALGSGHVMRCMTLADALRRAGAEVVFLSRRLAGNLLEFIAESGWKVYPVGGAGEAEARNGDASGTGGELEGPWQWDLEETSEVFSSRVGSVDWLIVDNYLLDYRWEKEMRAYCEKILAIDDLPVRSHDCDLLLDQNFLADEDEYRPLVPWYCKILAGPKYAALRREFRESRKRISKGFEQPRRVLISFGGSDPTNESAKALEALEMLGGREILADVLLGGSNPNADSVRRRHSELPGVSFYGHVGRPSELILKADLALGAGGVSELERCCLGLPALLVAVAENQEYPGRMAERTGAAKYLGRSADVTAEFLAVEIWKFLERPNLLREMSEKGVAQVDGLGADRVIREMKRLDEEES